MPIDLAVPGQPSHDGGTFSFHLSATRLAAFLEGRLTAPEREEAALHLSGCPDCRAELRDVQLGDGRVSRTRWSIWIPVVTGAAAVLAFFVLPKLTRQTIAADGLKKAEPVSAPVPAPQIQIVSPKDGARVSAPGLSFIWRSLGKNVTFKFTLSDMSGTTILSAQTPDTVVNLPPSVTLEPRADYFWFVDAALGGGRTTKTPAVRISTRTK